MYIHLFRFRKIARCSGSEPLPDIQANGRNALCSRGVAHQATVGLDGPVAYSGVCATGWN